MRFVGWAAYYAARFITLLLCKFLWRMEIVGGENVPKTGPFVLAPVHRSNIDGPLACVLVRRRMRFLSKEEMFKIAWLGKLFSAMGAIPVNRGAPDRKSLQTCLNEIEAGYPLVLFPEGGRRDGPIVEEILDGAAYIALKANVPVLPVGIAGAEQAQPRGSKRLRAVKVHVVIGQPFSLPSGDGNRVARSAVRESTEIIKTQLQARFDEAKARA